jgi:hypothetical protein
VTVALGCLSGLSGAWLYGHVMGTSQARVKEEALPRRATRLPASETPIPAPVREVPPNSKEECPPAPSPPTEGKSEAPARDHLPPEESIALERARQQERILAHEQEPIRTEWAIPMQNSIRSGFEGNLQRGMTHAKLQSVTCRYESCLARLAWDDAPPTQDETYLTVVSTDFAGNCSRHLTLEEPRGGGAHEATLVFDCGETVRTKEDVGL